MTESKSFKWPRSIHKATCYDKKTELTFSVTQNQDSSSNVDKFAYRCVDSHRRLIFDRKINFATALVVINSWEGEVEIEEYAPPGNTLQVAG